MNELMNAFMKKMNKRMTQSNERVHAWTVECRRKERRTRSLYPPRMGSRLSERATPAARGPHEPQPISKKWMCSEIGNLLGISIGEGFICNQTGDGRFQLGRTGCLIREIANSP